MPTKNPNSGFGDIEDDFFNQGDQGWSAPVDPFAEEAKREAEAARKAEEARLAEEARKEEARLAAEAKKAEEARKAAEAKAQADAKKAEEARKAAEAKAQADAKKAEEARKAAEAKAQADARKAEEARLAAEAKAQADAKKAEEARLAAEAQADAKKAEEARLAAEAKAQADAKKAEEARLAAEAQADAKKAEEARLAAEADARKAEEARLAAEADARKAEEARLAAEAEADARKAEEARLAAEAEAAEAARAAARALEASPSLAPTEEVAAPEPDTAELPDHAVAALPPAPPPIAVSGPGDWHQAVDLLVAAADLGPGDRRASRLVEAARLSRVRLGDPSRALELLDQVRAGGATQLDAANERAYWSERALAAELIRAWPIARESWESLATAPGADSAAALMRAAQAALAVGDRADADDLLAQAASGEGVSVPALNARLQLARARGDLAGQAELAGRLAALTTGPVAADWHAERAGLLDRLGDPAAAEAWAAAREADPTHVGALTRVEAASRDRGDWAQVVAISEAEARRLEAVSPVDAAFWLARAARVQRTARFDSAAALELYRRAVALVPADRVLRHDHQQLLAETGRWSELAASLEEEIAAAPEAARSQLHYRLARLCEEQLGDVDRALTHHREAARDPAAAPAAEAVLRLLQGRKDWRGLVEFLEERVTRLSDPALEITAFHRAGEACEGPLEDQAGAERFYERVLEVAPGFLPALEGLERVYTRLEKWAKLAALYEQRAILPQAPELVALHRHRAGAVYDFRLHDTARATEQFRLALDAVPDFPASLDAYTRVLEQQGDWTGLAGALRRAAAACRDGTEAVSLYYRAGRVYADKTDDVGAAMACLRASLERSPGFLPAVLLLKDLAVAQGAWAEFYDLERLQSEQGTDPDRRAWRMLSAAATATRLPDTDPSRVADEFLRADPNRPAAMEFAERVALAGGDGHALLTTYLRLARDTEDLSARAAYGRRAAEIAAEQGDANALIEALNAAHDAPGEGATRGLAALALARGHREEAVRFLVEGGLESSPEALRLGGSVVLEDPAAVARVRAALDAGDVSVAGEVVRASADPALLAAAHLALARHAARPAAAAWHGSAAGRAAIAAGDHARAVEAWALAHRAAPASREAVEGYRDALIAAADTDGLRALYAKLPEAERDGLGEALEAAGDPRAAAEAYAAAMATALDPLPWSLALERAQVAADDWRGVLATLQARMAGLDDAGRAAATARCRWILAEKLAESDEAWEQYRALHAANPDDVEVLEALARIATARGETALSLEYLERLSTRASDPAAAARYLRRVAEAEEKRGDLDAARAALARALDVRADDADALAELRRLCEAAGDWQGVVGVLARQAALTRGRRQVEHFMEIASIWETRIGDRAVAADAWRKVLDLEPDEPTAVAHLFDLCEANRDWSGFVEYGQMLLATTPVGERAPLQRRLGAALAEHLRREDDALRYFEAAAAPPTPDAEAAAWMERIYTQRGDWVNVVEALQRRALVGTPAERADALTRAARIRIDTLRDRAGAAAIYGDLLAIAPDAPDALRFRGEYLWEAGDWRGAAEVMLRLEDGELARDTDDFDTQVEVSGFCFRLAEALRRSGHDAEAVSRYERALGLNPTHLPSLEAVGPMYMVAEEWGKAEKVWKQLLQLTGGAGSNEQLARIYANLGVVEFHLGQTDRARKRFAKALELRPNDVAALRGMGALLYAAGDWHNLLNIYNSLIYHAQDLNDVVDAYLQKGFVLDTRLDLGDKAAQHYVKSLAFNPGQPAVLLRLGELALRRQDWPEAASLAERGLQLQAEAGGTRAGLLLVRAVAYLACGDADAATANVEEARGIDAWFAENVAAAVNNDHEQLHEVLRARLSQSARL